MTTFTWQDVLRDGEFHVPPDLWLRLKATMPQDAIIEMFQDAVDAVEMPFPFKEITLDQATDDFRRLRFLDTSELRSTGPWRTVTDYPYKYGFRDVSIEQSHVGLLSSNYFHQKYRYQCDNNTRNAGAVAWNKRKTRREIFKPLWTMKMTQVTPREIRACCALRTCVAAQFRPSAAKFMYDHYLSEGKSRVLDFSAGWGDRLSAALACQKVTHYTGIDPNTNLHPGYQAQVEAYNRDLDLGIEVPLMGPSATFVPKTVNMIHGPAEDVDIPGEYDLVFTSPPYFDKEYYSKEATQSWVRYKGIDAWLKGFMFPVIEKLWARLVPGGHLCINIVDTKNFNPSRRIEICDPMNDRIAKMPGAEYLGAMGMRMSMRPNLGEKSTGEAPLVEVVSRPEVPTEETDLFDFLNVLGDAHAADEREARARVEAKERKEQERASRVAMAEPIWMWKKRA